MSSEASDDKKKKGFGWFGLRRGKEEPETGSETPDPEGSGTETETVSEIEPPQADVPGAADTPSVPEEPVETAETVEPAETDVPEPQTDDQPKKKGFFARLKAGLSRTTNSISDGITGIFTKAKLDGDTLEELEDLLISSDLGVEVAGEVTKELAKGRFDKEIAPHEVRSELARIIADRLRPVAMPLDLDPARRPHVIMMVGVNGTGKTTTIGKLAHRFRAAGKSVTLAAGDTFRAAAIDQLKVWAQRTGADILTRDIGADAAALAFDALKQARDNNSDVLLIDTAGRLQNKQGLMDELAKVSRVLKKQDPDAPHSVVLVLDATTGQNAVSQVEVFKDVAGVTGLVMTKLDGTARGGILVSLAAKFGLPIHAIGVGESVDDFQPFDADDFARALTGAEGTDTD